MTVPGGPRFVAKSKPQGRFTVWGVYDTVRASWPVIMKDGYRVPQGITQAEAEAEVEKLNRKEAS